MLDLPKGVLDILDRQPDLITTYRSKDLLGFAAEHAELVEAGVAEMLDKGTSQDHLVRALAKQIKDLDGVALSIPRLVHGVGEIRADGRKIMLRCIKGVDPQALLKKISAFLEAEAEAEAKAEAGSDREGQ
jgi:ParB family chromosome partitioning protein